MLKADGDASGRFPPFSSAILTSLSGLRHVPPLTRPEEGPRGFDPYDFYVLPPLRLTPAGLECPPDISLYSSPSTAGHEIVKHRVPSIVEGDG